ncbi:flagellin [Devosia sp. RR2S18]|uniref:flagellin N-terminal helical domain-containing protein n=1 Tax=Devosia rhizosphaerae TaxID=3049774 RepID=UPI00253FC8C7|nr:flagellin [Devosia sp. RR2S18]WIJ26652.1 flagellin [Devosia sp. RR2S18]
MADISLSKAVRSNLLSLKSTADMMSTTQNRLATGNKVNSALDNPSSWFTAKGLTNRASDLNSLIDSMANGIQTLEAADNGLSAMTKTLESMQSTLRQARQDKSFQTASYTIGENATGNVSFSGGALTGTSDVSLTKAVPASITSGADYALVKAQGAVSATFAAANFDHADDKIDFAVTVDGGSPATVTVTKAIADQVATDGEITTAEQMRSALRLAVEAADLSDSVTIGGTANAIEFRSTSEGATSTMAVTATPDDGGGTDTMASTAGVGTFSSSSTLVQNANFTIGYEGETIDVALNGNVHDTADKAAKAINDAITAKNAGLAEADRFTLTASAKDGRLVLTGPADGTGTAITVTDTVASSGHANSVFGAPAQRQTLAPAENGGATKTVDELVTEINSKTKTDGTANELYGKLRASNDNGKLRIENQSTQELSVNGVNSLGVADGVSVADATMRKSIEGNSVRAGLADQFNELRDQLDKLADDASFNGINLLRGDKLTITFNETGTSALDIQTTSGETVNALNLGVPTQLEEEQLDSDGTIDGLLTNLKAALDEVRSQASTFGSNLSIVENRKSFTTAMIDTLESGAGNLTLADMNTEAANLLALQTRQQLSQNSLSLASQADQSILQLLQ